MGHVTRVHGWTIYYGPYYMVYIKTIYNGLFILDQILTILYEPLIHESQKIPHILSCNYFLHFLFRPWPLVLLVISDHLSFEDYQLLVFVKSLLDMTKY